MFKIISVLGFCSISALGAVKQTTSTGVSLAAVSSPDSRPVISTIALLQTNLAVLSKGGGYINFEFSKMPQISLGFSLYNLMEKENAKVTTTSRYGFGGTYYLNGVQASRTVFAGAGLYFGQQSTRETFKENIENLTGLGFKAGGHLILAQNVLVDVGVLMTGFSGYFVGEPLLGIGFTF